MRISVRTARIEDASALAALSGQLGYPVEGGEMVDRLARVRAQRFGEVFVGLAEGEAGVLGWTHVVPRLQLEEPPFAELAGLVVADSARGAGIGAALLAAAEDVGPRSRLRADARAQQRRARACASVL